MQLTRARPLVAIAAALCVPLTARGQALPDSHVGSRVAVYADDDATTVVTGAVEAQATVGEAVAVRAGYLVDVVTTASVDVVAAASKVVHDERDEVRGGIDLFGDDAVLSIDLGRSVEVDWTANRATLGGSLDLADHATRLSGSAGVVLSDVGRAGDDGFRASQRAHALTLGVTQALDARTLVSIGYAGQLVIGMQSSPYRFVTLGDGTRVPETHPDQRVRHALVARLRRALGPRTSVGVDERLYGDDWGILASTTGASLSLSAGEHFTLSLQGRLHAQGGASFYKAATNPRPRYVTADRELGPMVDVFAGPWLSYQTDAIGPLEHVRLDARLEGFWYEFLDPDRIGRRFGTMMSLGLEGVL